MATYNSIRPGKVWLDTSGKRIQAHGGSIIEVDGTYYWYGENKEKTTGDTPLWHMGVRCYSSKDFYNWKDEGLIIPPDEEHPESPLHPNSLMDRPHIIYNQHTKKFVAWLKIMDEPPKFAVLSADHILGPYKMINPKVNPCGMLVGDFDLQVDQTTQKGYLISQNPHTSIYVAELNDEYTDAAGTYSEHFLHTAPPEAREAPAHFVRNGKHYLITSGTTGYFPNPSEAAIADDWNGPYTVQGNPHVEDSSHTSFCSQITSVFKVPRKKDLYIALADRWMPELQKVYGSQYQNGEMEAQIQEKFRRIFNPDANFVFTEQDAKDMRINSSISDYVWLPLLFEGETVRLQWMDEWKLEDFE